MSQIPETINPRDLLGDMPDSEIELHTRTIADGVKPACGLSLRTLRCQSGKGLREASKVIRRAHNTLSDWENCTTWPQSNAHLPLLLQSFGVPPQLIIDSFGPGHSFDDSLSPAEYLSRDALGIAELELAFMTSRRGSVLMALTKAAIANGSATHAALWFERLADIEREVMDRKSITVSASNRNTPERLLWMRQSVNKSTPAPEPDPDLEGSKD